MKTKMTARADAISARERVHQVEADCSRNEHDHHVRQRHERKMHGLARIQKCSRTLPRFAVPKR